MTAQHLYLHIGRQKSGTTSLQQFLTYYRKELGEAGVCYPVAGSQGSVAHHALALLCHHNSTDSKTKLDLWSEEFALETASFEKIIVSSEFFQNIIGDHNLRRFFRRQPKSAGWPSFFRRQALPRYNIHTISYLREFLDYASSAYAQKVQTSGLSLSFDSYCQEHVGRFNLARFHKFWIEFSDSTTFRIFERDRLYEKDVVADIFQLIGVRLPGPLSSIDANPSISGNLLGFKLLVNSLGRHDGEMYEGLRALALTYPQFRGRFAVPDADAGALRERFSSYNSFLQTTVGEFQIRSFSNGGIVGDPASWHEDLEIILAHPAFSALLDVDEVVNAQPSDVQKIFNG